MVCTMRILLRLVLMASTLMASTSQGYSFGQPSQQKKTPTKTRPRALVIRNVTLIDGTGSSPRQHTTLVITGQRISAISRDKNLRVPGAKLVEATGKFAIPGLWDMHVHLTFASEVSLPLFVSYGVTSVRDMGSDLAQVQSWRRRIEDGSLWGPRIKSCGPMLESAQAMRELKESGISEANLRLHMAVTDPQQAREVVSSLARQGVDCIKMRSYENSETYFALAAAAKSAGLKLVGHAPWGIDPVQASDAGQATFEHGFYPWPLDKVAPSEKQNIFEHFLRNDSMIDPTLVSWEGRAMPFADVEAIVNDWRGRIDSRRRQLSPVLVDRWCENLLERKQENREGEKKWHEVIDSMAADVGTMHKAGVGVLAGTDVGGVLSYPGSGVHEEMQLLVSKVHLAPMEALMSATSLPAKAVGSDHETGTIQEGKLADIVLLDSDPSEDIANVNKIYSVILDGHYLNAKDIQQIRVRVEHMVQQETKRFHKRCVSGSMK